MKTTLEIPDSIFRRAKSVAAERGRDNMNARTCMNARTERLLHPQ